VLQPDRSPEWRLSLMEDVFHVSKLTKSLNIFTPMNIVREYYRYGVLVESKIHNDQVDEDIVMEARAGMMKNILESVLCDAEEDKLLLESMHCKVTVERFQVEPGIMLVKVSSASGAHAIVYRIRNICVTKIFR